MHPSNKIEHEYAVRVIGEVTPQNQKTTCFGVVLDDRAGEIRVGLFWIGGDGIQPLVSGGGPVVTAKCAVFLNHKV